MDYFEKSKEMKIIDGSECYDRGAITSECFSRIQCINALHTLNPDLKIHNAPQMYVYDIYFRSGDTMVGVETKDRNYYDSLPDIRVSYKKWNDIFNKPLTDHQQIWFCSTLKDGIAYIWDIHNAPYTIKKWTHNKYSKMTNTANYSVCEDVVVLNKKDAKYRIIYDRSKCE